MKINERRIIKSCQAGNLEQFGLLYEQYVKKIYNFTYYKTTSREVAEDLTSQTFFKALNGIGRFDDKGSFSAWLYTIARNTIIDHYRSQRPESNIEDAWDLYDDSDIENEIDVQSDLKKVKKYMTKLDPAQREIVMLRVWEDLSYKEIALITGKSEQNCRMIFSRTIAKIRQEALIALLIIIFLS